MNYERFVRIRSAAWNAFASNLASSQRGRQRPGYTQLESLARDYRHVLHDHALAASRFPGTGASRKLHALAVEGARQLQVDEKDQLPTLRAFFATTFPSAIRAQATTLCVTGALFAAAFLLVASLVIGQPGLGTAILGPVAVEGLKRGHLWTESLVTTVPPSLSSSAIATNNMSVALAGWAGGSVFGLGSIYVALINGGLLGAVLAITCQFGLAGELLRFVAAHGPLEITLILVTAAAGLSLGGSLIVADDRPRALVVREASRQALIVLLGCLPWFVILGLVEGFVSPSTAVPVFVKVGLGLGLELAFLLTALGPRPRGKA